MRSGYLRTRLQSMEAFRKAVRASLLSIRYRHPNIRNNRVYQPVKCHKQKIPRQMGTKARMMSIGIAMGGEIDAGVKNRNVPD